MAKQKPTTRPTDAAGVGPYARELEHLVPLSRLNGWNVTEGEVDIRKWDVKTVSGRVLGSVRELLVDPKAGEVVMIDMDLAGSPHHAYVPLRIVEIDRAQRIVRADSADIEAVTGGRDADAPVESVQAQRSVRYATDADERVIERRPIVEETVVRRRDAEEPETRF